MSGEIRQLDGFPLPLGQLGQRVANGAGAPAVGVSVDHRLRYEIALSGLSEPNVGDSDALLAPVLGVLASKGVKSAKPCQRCEERPQRATGEIHPIGMCPESAEHFLADVVSRRRGAKDLVGDAKDHGVMLVPRGLERPRIALEETFEDLSITAELDYLAVHAYRLRNDAVGAVIADCRVADQLLMEAFVNALSTWR